MNPLPHVRRELVRVRVSSPRLLVRDAHTLEPVAHQLLPLLVPQAAAADGDWPEQVDSRFSFARDAFDVRFLRSLASSRSLTPTYRHILVHVHVRVYSYT